MITVYAKAYLPTRQLFLDLPLPTNPDDGYELLTPVGAMRIYFDPMSLGAPSPPEEVDELAVAVTLENVPEPLLEMGDAATNRWPGVADWLESHEHFYRTAGLTTEASSPSYFAFGRNRSELHEIARKAAEEWIGDERVSYYLAQVARAIHTSVLRVLENLRVVHGQTLMADPPRFSLGGVQLVFGGSSTLYLSREAAAAWLGGTADNSPAFVPPTINLGEIWTKVRADVEGDWKPRLLDILIANAQSQCQSDHGSPRLALVEAVTALEIAIKKVMSTVLSTYGVSKSGIDRIVRETSTADLIGVWIRPYVDVSLYPDLERCAEAVRERNELIHHERRSVKQERAVQMVGAVQRVIHHVAQVA